MFTYDKVWGEGRKGRGWAARTKMACIVFGVMIGDHPAAVNIERSFSDKLRHGARGLEGVSIRLVIVTNCL